VIRYVIIILCCRRVCDLRAACGENDEQYRGARIIIRRLITISFAPSIAYWSRAMYHTYSQNQRKTQRANYSIERRLFESVRHNYKSLT
jgi:hypothetical protein